MVVSVVTHRLLKSLKKLVMILWLNLRTNVLSDETRCNVVAARAAFVLTVELQSQRRKSGPVLWESKCLPLTLKRIVF